MEDKSKAGTKTSKLLKLLLKIALTAICLWYVSGKIDLSKSWSVVKTADGVYLFLALLAFLVSKLISAVRLNIYFKNTGLHLSFFQNLKLYLLGMFYNLFLPGSISGDAYKVILLKKKYNAAYKKTTAAVLLDRFSGLAGLGLILSVYSIFVIDRTLYVVAVITGALLAVGVLYFVIRRWLKDFIPGFFGTLFMGILVQAAQVICAYLIMAALGIPAHVTEYIYIFLISSVVSVLPLTIGGLGIREVVFLEGSGVFGLDQETSVVISLLFYLITLVSSAAGVFYVFRDPLSEKKKDPLLSP